MNERPFLMTILVLVVQEYFNIILSDFLVGGEAVVGAESERVDP